MTEQLWVYCAFNRLLCVTVPLCFLARRLSRAGKRGTSGLPQGSRSACRRPLDRGQAVVGATGQVWRTQQGVPGATQNNSALRALQEEPGRLEEAGGCWGHGGTGPRPNGTGDWSPPPLQAHICPPRAKRGPGQQRTGAWGRAGLAECESSHACPCTTGPQPRMRAGQKGEGDRDGESPPAPGPVLTACSLSVSSRRRLRHLAAASLFRSLRTRRFSSSSGVS